MTIKTNHKIIIALLLIAISTTANSSITLAQPGDTDTPEVGVSFPGEPPPNPFFGHIEWNTALDFAFMYSHLSGEDMSGTYGGIPQLSAGISWALSDISRFFMSVGYGHRSGDPYWNIDNFSSDQEVTLKTIPFLMGLKTNVSSRDNFRMYFGAAAQMSYTWETIPTGIVNGELTTATPSGLLTGYYLFMGPEFPLGQSNNALGLELGYGGTKGEVSGHGTHDVDLTGFHFRAYYTMEK